MYLDSLGMPAPDLLQSRRLVCQRNVCHVASLSMPTMVYHGGEALLLSFFCDADASTFLFSTPCLSRGGCQSLSQKKIQPFQARPFHQCHAMLAYLQVGLLKSVLVCFGPVHGRGCWFEAPGVYFHFDDFVAGSWQLFVVNKTPSGACGTSGADLPHLQIYLCNLCMYIHSAST